MPLRSQQPPVPPCRCLPRTTRLALGGARQLPMAMTRLNSLSMRSTAYRALNRRLKKLWREKVVKGYDGHHHSPSSHEVSST